MANLSDTAQVVMDMYFQNYKTDEDFFILDHFVYLCGVAYSKILEDEYKQARKEAKAEEGFTEIFLADEWLIEQVVEMKKSQNKEGSFYGDLPKPAFSFPFDPYSFGIQSVQADGVTSCNSFIRSTLREAWMDCQLPMTSKAFYYVSAGRIYVTNARCTVDKLKIQMVPEITSATFGLDGGPVPKSKEDLIIRSTLDLMMRARQGTVVDMSNNSNPNKNLETEIDRAFSKT